MRDSKILVIDDDPDLCLLVRHVLARTGANIKTVVSGRLGLQVLGEFDPDLIVLDIMMPDMNGWETLSRIRQVSDVPVLMLTALDGDDVVIRALDSGAVGFVNKPFGPMMLVARIRALLRHLKRPFGPETSRVFQDDHLLINTSEDQILVQGTPVKLTATERRLLYYFLRNAGRSIPHRELLANVWGEGYGDAVAAVHVYVSRLRKRLEPDPSRPCYITTDHGVGYKFKRPQAQGGPGPQRSLRGSILDLAGC